MSNGNYRGLWNMANNESEHPPVDPQVAERLLALLSSDDAYRSRFSKDPTAALAEVGHRLPEGVEPLCMSTNQLAPKEEIAAAHEQLKSFLMSSAAYNIPHCLEAGKISSALPRK